MLSLLFFSFVEHNLFVCIQTTTKTQICAIFSRLSSCFLCLREFLSVRVCTCVCARVCVVAVLHCSSRKKIVLVFGKADFNDRNTRAEQDEKEEEKINKLQCCHKFSLKSIFTACAQAQEQVHARPHYSY